LAEQRRGDHWVGEPNRPLARLNQPVPTNRSDRGPLTFGPRCP
jgi:hypothetical protein